MVGASWPRLDRCRAFPSPNYQWFKENAKSTFDVVYFPLWTFEALDDANTVFNWASMTKLLLNLITSLHFVGTARFTLTMDLKFYDRGIVSIDKAFSTYFKSYDAIHCQGTSGHVCRFAETLPFTRLSSQPRF